MVYLCVVIINVIFLGREIALVNAQKSTPLKREVGHREVYPNVYDALAEAKAGGAYVGGSKVNLTYRKYFKIQCKYVYTCI